MTDWKRKLAAYLHDPPSKCLDIQGHGDRSDAAFRQAGFTGETVGEYSRPADHAGAAADRLPFPGSRSAGVACSFDGIRNSFLHPLTGQKVPFHAEFKSQELVFDGEGSVQPVLSEDSLAALSDDDKRFQARFFAHWRLWPKYATEQDYRMALLPADTRIPDHSIWTHMGVVSALSGCAENGQLRPAFLKFQLGPVQEFIAAARSIRDLWSGSYMLSWLMAAGLKALSAEVGPDSVIFPNLREQPLFDLHWRDELWAKVNMGKGAETVWESLDWSDRELLTPNLPNVFLAVVPAARAHELAPMVKKAIENEWEQIAFAVWTECEKAGLTADESEFTAEQRKQRFDTQVKRFLSISWRITPWPESLDAALGLADGFAEGMPIVEARKRVQVIKDMAEKQMLDEHRDWRFYVGGKDGPKKQLNNLGLGWSVILALNSWELDAVRQTRSFDAVNAGGWQVGTFSNKDALTGREEAVAGGRVWVQRAAKAGSPWASLFKRDDWVGASTLIKRTWHRAYLAAAPWKLSTDARHFPMPNTRGVAAHNPEQDCDADETAEDAAPSEKYFAVLAFDGDEIGKWISGEKTPVFATQLADYKDGLGNTGFGSKSYFSRPEFGGFLNQQRPLSPSYHLQFSEALGNFALLCARPIVESYLGRLIYAGGDDVVALLPADTALACAEALRAAFTGHEVKAPDGSVLFRSPAPGFLSSDGWKDDHNRGRPIPFLVPGPKADASVGIAIAHFKSPLQDVVRAAQAAEKRAKKQLNRSAFAVTLFKRSGETIEWGCKWAGGGLQIYRAFSEALDSGRLSGKFPYRFAELLSPYLIESTPLIAAAETAQTVPAFNVTEIIQQEFKHTLGRQHGPNFPTERAASELFLTNLTNALCGYLNTLQGENSEVQLRAIIGLCQTVAFAHRTRSEAAF
jgi:CRISPR-associated protein Cas10/Cmr2 subtype III-B